MARLSEAIGIGLVSLSLLFSAYGTDKKETSKPDTQPEKVTYHGQMSEVAQRVPPEKAANYYGQIGQLAEKVLNLSDYLFPASCGTYKGAIYIGKVQKEAKRYVVIDGWKGNDWRSRRLNIGVYTGLNSDVDKYLSNQDYKSAVEALSNSNLRMIGFYDLDANGLTGDLGDFLVIRDKEGGEFIAERPTWLSEDVLRKVNDAYRFVLETIEPILEKERKSRKEREADRKREEEETRKRKIMQSLTELIGDEF